MEVVLALLGGGGGLGGLLLVAKQGYHYYKVAKEAMVFFEELKTRNSTFIEKAEKDPRFKNLTVAFKDGSRWIKGLG